MTRHFVVSTRRIALVGVLICAVSGCSLVQQKAVPVSAVPDWIMARPKATREPINLISLRVDPPEIYQLGPRDVLGIYIDGVLGSNEAPPPVHFPTQGDMAPALGYPVPVGDDGKLYLPLVKPIDVRGMTLAQAREEIRKAYIEEQILTEQTERILVTIIRKRTNQVLVVREDSGNSAPAAGVVLVGPAKRGNVVTVDLPVDESDVMHALAASGGMPGLDAKNEIVILRGKFTDAIQRDRFLSEMCQIREYVGSELWVKPDSNVLRIPLRAEPGAPPRELREQDVMLQTGDIIFIETREREVYYTGGLLPGREIPLPRDYDLDVLAAISLAGGSASTGVTASSRAGMGGGQGGGGSGGIVPASEIIVVRRLPDGTTVPIRICLSKAIVDSSQRILIQPGDYVLLQYTPWELAANIVLGNVTFNYFLNKIDN